MGKQYYIEILRLKSVVCFIVQQFFISPFVYWKSSDFCDTVTLEKIILYCGGRIILNCTEDTRAVVSRQVN